MARSRWKLIYFSNSIWRKISMLKKKLKFKKKIFFDRASSIPKCFVSKLVRINKGKRHRNIIIEKMMIGKKFGEFSFTRKPYHFPAKRSKKKKNNYSRR